jgi:glycosyltransferase involved in cell wall biosynthesis
MDTKRKISVIGDILGTSGYASHTRQLALALDKYFDVRVEPMSVVPGWEGMVQPKIVELVNKRFKPEANVMISFPYFWGLKSADRVPFVGFGVFEGSKVHSSWTKCSNKDYISQIWTPSTHVKESFLAGGVTRPIEIVPHGVDLGIYNTEVKPNKKDRFQFLYVGGWAQFKSDRRAVDLLIEAFSEEFPNGEAELVLKVNPAYGQNVYEDMKKLSIPTTAKIKVSTSALSDKQMAALYKTADVFVMPTKAEGFCLPCLEAMAVGTPVIATNYGGQTDFINPHNGWLINIEKMIPATDRNVFYEEAEWAMPSKEHLKQLMRIAYEDNELRKTKGIAAADDAKEWTWDNAAKQAAEKLSKLLGTTDAVQP